MMKVEATRYYDLEERLLELSVWIIRLSEPQNPVPAPDDPIQISMFHVECSMFLPHIQRYDFFSVTAHWPES